MVPTITIRMAVSILFPLLAYVWIPSWSSPVPAPDPSELSEDVNMNVSNLGEALFFLTGVFISAVQPQPTPMVALQLIMPISTRFNLVNFTRVFYTENMTRTPSSVEVRSVMTWTTNEIPGPGDMLKVLCKDTFQHNVVTVMHINNPKVSRNFTDVSAYLLRLLDSVGLPVISWDSDFSNARQTERSLQLAPTLYHQTEAMLAFMKRFSWKYFSMVTTQVVGHEDFFAALRSQESQSRRHALPNKYGHVGFEYKILSDIVLRSMEDKEKVEIQLYEEMDPDTRIILLHSSPAEAKDILDVAQKMGWTGREYVWILSATALGDRTAGDSANAYPLGIFAVTYDSSINDMREVITRGIRVWLQGMKDLDADGRVDKWNWETKLSCEEPQLKKWPGGQLLFEYLRNVSLAGSKDETPTEFSDTGMVKLNKLSILNVMQQADTTPGRSAYTSPYSSSSARGDSHHRGYRSRRSHFPFPGPNFPSLDSSLSSGEPIPSAQFGKSGLLSTGDGGSGGLDSSLGSVRSKSSMSLSVKSEFSTGSDPLPSKPSTGLFSEADSLSSSSSAADMSFSSTSLHSTQSEQSSSETASDERFLLNGRKVKVSPVHKNSAVQQTTQPVPPSFSSATFGLDPKGSRNVKSDVSISEDHHLAHGRTNAQAERSPERTRDRQRLSSQARRHSSRRRRQTRSSRSLRQKFQKVATWDGKDLKVVEITWPGNSVYPPKGVPETYHLNVATYLEEPHVSSKPLNEKGECDPHATICTVYDRDERDNRRPGMQTVERCCSGLSIDILDRISKDLNFNYSLFEVESAGYGSAVEYTNNTEWTGLVGTLMKHEADVAMAALSITKEREKVIDFSIPFLETGITIVVAIRKGAISPTAFLEPYDYPSWTLILVFSVHATGASIFIFEWLSPYGLDQGHTPLRVHKFSLFRSFWLIWAMLFGAAVSTDMPRGVSSRFLANIWALFAVVFLASYTANLAAFMITKEEYYDLSGIQDWRLKNPHHRHPPFKYATMPNSATETNIRNNHKDLYQHMKKYPQYSVKEAVASLKDQRIQAFIYDATTLEYAVGRDVGCKLKSVGKRYAETGYGVGFPRKSRWTKKFNNILLRMQDEGEIERLQKFWLAGACHKKSQQRGSSSHTLGILNFTSAFILLGGGVVLGALLLMLEHIYFRFGRKSLKKWDRCGCCSLVSLSMGKSLTFEQSVMEAIDLQKHHKCRDPLCETQLWKAKHELDIALLKIDQLEKQVAKQAARDGESENNEVIDGSTEASPHKDCIPRKRVFQSSPHPSSRRSKAPSISPRSDNAESVGGPAPPLEQFSKEKSYGSYSPSSQSENGKSPFRTFVRRTRVSDGKLYENVDVGLEIESTI